MGDLSFHRVGFVFARFLQQIQLLRQDLLADAHTHHPFSGVVEVVFRGIDFDRVFPGLQAGDGDRQHGPEHLDLVCPGTLEPVPSHH